MTLSPVGSAPKLKPEICDGKTGTSELMTAEWPHFHFVSKWLDLQDGWCPAKDDRYVGARWCEISYGKLGIWQNHEHPHQPPHNFSSSYAVVLYFNHLPSLKQHLAMSNNFCIASQGVSLLWDSLICFLHILYFPSEISPQPSLSGLLRFRIMNFLNDETGSALKHNKDRSRLSRK